MLNKNRVGLTLGCFSLLVHVVWSLLVAISPDMMQSFYDWILQIHFLYWDVVVGPFVFLDAVLLWIVAFAGAYVVGWLLAGIYNWLNKAQ